MFFSRRRETTEIQILFWEPMPTEIVLDCIVLRPSEALEDRLPAGSPIVLRVARPDEPPLDVAAVRILGRWANDCRPISLRFLEVHGEPRVRLQDGDTTLQLDLERAAA